MVINVKINRLISILTLLLRKERVQARELAERFGVSVRTILRDVEALNLAGLPIVTYQGFNGGIGIAEGYRLDRSILNADEMSSIITSLEGMARVLPENRHEILLEKLKNILSLSQLETVDVKTRQLVIDPTPWLDTRHIKEKLTVLKKAIEECKVAEFRYIDPTGNETQRRVEPYSLLMKGQNWYLYGFCLLRQDFRFFKLTRIREFQITDGVFAPRPLPEERSSMEKEWRTTGNPVALELRFEKYMKAVVTEWFGEDVAEDEDGQFRVHTVLPENKWLYGFLLSFGSGVEVVSPPHIRAVIGGIAEKIAQKHATNMT